MRTAEAWNKTVPCPKCGSIDATWNSKFLGGDVLQDGDFVVWCKACSELFDVMAMEYLKDVLVAPGGLDWASRDEWYHVSGPDWLTHCPDSVYVHVGPREVCEWLMKIRKLNGDGVKEPTLYRLRVKDGKMPKRLVRDVGDGWINRRTAYVQLYEVPGSVCLLLPKRDLEIIDITPLS